MLMNGCAVISEEACPGTDWYQKGMADGSVGYTASRIDAYVQVCSRVGVVVDVDAYYRGREQGLSIYCTPQRGHEEGLRGAPYRQVCPPPKETGFLQAYQHGRSIYDARQSLQRLESEIRQEENRLKKARRAHERQRIRQRIRNLDNDASHARETLRQAESQALPTAFY